MPEHDGQTQDRRRGGAEYEVELGQKQEELAALQEELGGALEEFDECPLCGATIDHACEEE